MNESGFTPQGFARTIAGREVGANRLDPVLGKLQKLSHDYSEKEIAKSEHIVRSENPPIDAKQKGESNPDPTFSDMMRKQAEEMSRSGAQVYGARKQGKYEKAIQEAGDESEKARVQEEFVEELKPEGIKEALYGYEDAYGERQHATPLETVHGIATVENQLFDRVQARMIKSREIKDPKKLTPDENQEIQKRVDREVRQIGMTLLRGMAIPNPYGQILVDKAIVDSRKILEK